MNQRQFIDRSGAAWTTCTSCGMLRHVSQMPGGSPCTFCLTPPAPRQDVPPTVRPYEADGRKWFNWTAPNQADIDATEEREIASV